jgi:hypothetical protein
MLSPVAPFRAALRHRNLRILFAGQTASDAGDWLYNVALLALVFDRTAPRRSSASRPRRACCRSSSSARWAASCPTASTGAR